MIEKVMKAFKFSHAISKFEKMRNGQAVQFERVKLLTISFRVLIWYKNKKKMMNNLQLRTQNAYDHFAKKRGLRSFIINCRIKKHRHSLNN